jgi:hypothetical protein
MPHLKKKTLAARVADALTQLGEAVNSLPIQELTSPIEKERGLQPEEAHRTHARYLRLEESIENLAMSAALAHPDAIRELHYLGRFIQDRLNDIDAPSKLGAGQDTHGHTKDDLVEEDDHLGQSLDGCNSVNEAADRLCGILDEGYDELREGLGTVIEGLPTAHFSFPLERLLKLDAPPGEALALVSEICDRLIQERLNNACRKILCDLRAQAELPDDLPPGWDAKSRKEGGPTQLVRSVFIALENERQSFRSEAERAELKVRSQSWPSAQQFITTIKDAWKAHQYRYGIDRSKMFVDDLPWPLMRNKAWTERAALLPPLSSHKDVITQWADAGLFWIIAQRDGVVYGVKWNDSINKKIVLKGSLGGLKLFLREGFATLARTDCEGETP